MALLLQHLVEAPRPCSYLDAQQAELEHLLMREVRAQELDALLSRGWRRFGPDYFRPACRACQECEPLRIATATFRPSRSQRKAAARCRRFRREVGAPQVDAARLALYAAWHAEREEAREWKPSGLTRREYLLTFGGEPETAREVTWWDDADPASPRLVAVGYYDQTARSSSAIYFFYDPALASLSPGTANVVFAVEDALAQGIEHLYLGFRVRGCASLRYKGTFGPHELLQGRPEFSERPDWAPGDRDSPTGGADDGSDF